MSTLSTTSSDKSTCQLCGGTIPSRRSKKCRAFQTRTLRVTRRALDTWSGIFKREAVEFDPSGCCSCACLAKAVKRRLGTCPSSSEEEVMAFQSIKKLQPDSCACMEPALLEGIRKKFSSRGPPLPSGYLEFVRRRTRAMFPKAWDSSYVKFCELLSPPISACEGSSRQNGGILGTGMDHAEILDAVFGRSDFDPSEFEAVPSCGFSRDPPKGITCQALVVQSAGKPRPLSKFKAESLLLKPLHKTIYGWLSKKKWLLRGGITDEKLQRAGFHKEGGCLVSGDYSSATDNLPIEVVEVILDELQKTACFVPSSIFKYARGILRPLMWCFEPDLEIDWEIKVVRGQMMGSLLSFPMLCLQNRLGLEWACHTEGRKVPPCLINGDDILYQVPDECFVSRWMRVVGELGLEVEPTKTSVSTEYGTLNSTLLRWKEDQLLSVVHTLRFGQLRRSENPTSLSQSFFSFIGGVGSLPSGIRWRSAHAFFSWHSVELRDRSGCGYYPDELGFRGRLAFRLCEKFGLFRGRDPRDQIREPPVGHIQHNVVLPADQCTQVCRGDYGEEFGMEVARATASWKWGVEYETVKEGQVRWALSLACPARWRAVPSSLDDAKFQLRSSNRINFRLTSESERVIWRRRFSRPWEKKEIWPILDVALLEQLREFCPLPKYSEVEDELILLKTQDEEKGLK
nr:MAG: RNA-dependent RNA polymerase [Botourmiaviridae sp.]